MRLLFVFLATVTQSVSVCEAIYSATSISHIQMNNTAFPVIDRAATLAGLSPYGYRGDATRVHQALRRDLDQKKNLTIVLLGASVTTGFGLTGGEERYSILLQRYLQEVFEVNVTVRNYAIRAAASDVQADILFRKHMSRLLQSSLVLVDISVNDRPSHRDVKNEAKRVSRFMASNQSQAGADQHYQQQEKVFAEGRKLMKLLLYYLPKTVGIAYFETFVSGGRTSPLIRTPADLIAAHSQGHTHGRYEHSRESTYHFGCKGQDVSRNYHWQPLVEYKIPVISYLDMVCPFTMAAAAAPFGAQSERTQSETQALLRQAKHAFWGPNLHHGAVYHKFTAVILAHAIHEYALHDISVTPLDGDLPAWMPHQGPVTKQQISDWNAYLYNASSGAELNVDTKTVKCAMEPLQRKLKVSGHGSDWSYYEDVPGKPGWISSSGSNSNSNSGSNSGSGSSVAGRSAIAGAAGAAGVVSAFSLQRNPPRSITFSVMLERIHPIIKLSVLMSYDPKMGVLRCCVDPYGPSFCHSIDTLWTDQTSQIMTVDLTFPEFPENPKKSVLNRDLICTADGGKVKVVDMITC